MKHLILILFSAAALGSLTAELPANAAAARDTRMVNKQGGAKTRLPNSNRHGERDTRPNTPAPETALA